MAKFNNREELELILSELWNRILADSAIVKSLAIVKIIVKFSFKDMGTDLYIDNTHEVPGYYWKRGESSNSDVEMILSSDTAHDFWMEELNVPIALAGRKIIAKGSLSKALKLLPALKPAFALYPQVLRDLGRADLLTAQKNIKKKKKFISLFKKRNAGKYDLDSLPIVALPSGVSQRSSFSVDLSESEKYPADILKMMYRIRYFEEHLSSAFAAGDLPTEAIHLSIGQEGVAAGICMNLRKDDFLNTTHRGHGHIIAKGADLKGMMAELYGKAAGLCKGKGGSMHVTDGSKGILGANGIVGAGYLLAMGAGLSIKMKGTDNISVVIAGDGSVNQGMFHEAMNMCGVFSLPVLVVIENNLYGEFTSVARHSAVTELYKRAEAFGIESCRINGNDAIEVFSKTKKIIDAMRKDRRPRLIECMTYRWRGHMEGEPELYRSAEEKDSFMGQDPILSLENYLVQQNGITREMVQKIRVDAKREIDESVDYSVNLDMPQLPDLLTEIFSPEDDTVISGDFSVQPGGETRILSVSMAINEAIAEEMRADETVFLWGEDVALGGYFNVSDGLIDTFGPERIIDTPISENAIVGGGVGAAMTGMRPIIEILFADFLTCCMDPIMNQAAKLRYMTGGQVSIPLTVRTPQGNGIGMAAQHSQSMEKYFMGIPGLIVVAPSDAFTAKGLLKSAIRSNNPVLFLEHKLLYPLTGPVPDYEYTLPLGKARIARDGTDVTIVSFSMGVNIAIESAKFLTQKGINTEVVDLVTVYPPDYETVLKSVAKTGYLVTIDEGNAIGSVGSEIIASVAIAGMGLLKANPLRIAAPESPVPYAKNLEQSMIPDPRYIAEMIEGMI